MALKRELRVYGTREELEEAAAGLEKPLRRWLVNGTAFVLAANVANALWEALQAETPGLSCEELTAAPSFDDVLKAAEAATPEQKAALKRALGK
jgi:hypothetical protein